MTENGTSNNIGVAERHHIQELSHYRKNPRLGNIESIKTSILVNGVFRPLIVNRGTHTGRPLEVLAGNHSLKAMRQLAGESPHAPRWQKPVDCWVVDVDDDHAARIVLADNRTADLGGYDDQQLLALLELADGDLEGTGYDEGDLDELRKIGDDPPLPEEDSQDKGEGDLNVILKFSLPPPLAEQWYDHMRGFDSPEEALEHLLDHGN